MAVKGRGAQQHEENALLFVGTTKGVFVYHGDFEREKWKRTGPFVPEAPVVSIAYDFRDQKTVYIGTRGGGLHRSQDLGRTWEKVGKGLPTDKVTFVAVGALTEPRTVIVGLEPAGIAWSRDAGATFVEVEGFKNCAAASEWAMGGVPAAVISIVLQSPAHMHVAVNTAGVLATEDGGKTWSARNEGIPAGYPAGAKLKDIHREVFAMKANPAKPDRLYAVAKAGLFRTDDGGDSWRDITKGLSSKHVRSLAVSPFKPGGLLVVPLPGGSASAPKCDGQLVIFRSDDGGETWNGASDGLPENVSTSVLRDALCMDTLDEEGMYVGTADGSIFVSLNGGEEWFPIATGLSTIHALEVVTEQE